MNIYRGAVAVFTSLPLLLPASAAVFQAPLPFPSSGAPSSYVSADFNGDGKPDLAILNQCPTNAANCKIDILLGKGFGNFGVRKTFTANGKTPTVIAAGDLNGDGKQDLVTGNDGDPSTGKSGGFGILLGKGDGTFTIGQSVGISPAPGFGSVVIADVNGDGKADIVAGAGNNSAVIVALGKGDGTFNPPVLYPIIGAVASRVALGDFNQDGKLDIAATVNSNGASVGILVNNGDGSFAQPVLYNTGQNGLSIAIGDFNGDHHLDVAIGGINEVSILKGLGDGTFNPGGTPFTGTSIFDVGAADLNQDGKSDLLVEGLRNAVGGTPVLAVLLSKGAGAYEPTVYYDSGATPVRVLLTDLNGDQNPDVAFLNSSSGGSVVLSNGDGTLKTPAAAILTVDQLSTSIGPSQVADMNGDGRPDLIVGSVSGPAKNKGSLSVLVGNGDGTYQAPVTYPLPPILIWFLVSDLNGDGKPDVAAVCQQTAAANATLTVFLNKGDGTLKALNPLPLGAPGAGAYSMAAADFNNDSKTDLAVSLAGEGARILLGKGDGTFKIGGLLSGPFTGLIAAAFRSGGNSDLVAIDPTAASPAIDVFLGNGNGAFAKAAVYPLTKPAISLTLGRFNSDPNLDIAASSAGGFSVLLNHGGGTFGAATFTKVSGADGPITAADVNVDGNQDLVLSGHSQGSSRIASAFVTLLPGNGDGTFNAPASYPLAGSAVTVSAVDLDGDANPDLVIPIAGTSYFNVLINTGH
jgi:hypothetical protein